MVRGSHSESGWQLSKTSLEENAEKMEAPCITRGNVSLSFSYCNKCPTQAVYKETRAYDQLALLLWVLL